MMSPLMYYYTRVMYDLFVDVKIPERQDATGELHASKTFESSSDVFDFWNVSQTFLALVADFVKNAKCIIVFPSQYLRGPMLDGLYWENWYGTTRNMLVRPLADKDKNDGVLYENQLIGVPQLRQVRKY